jgi:hypothetical protein
MVANVETHVFIKGNLLCFGSLTGIKDRKRPRIRKTEEAYSTASA